MTSTRAIFPCARMKRSARKRRPRGAMTRPAASSRTLKQTGETDERMFAVAAWRDAPYFTDAERAAMALTEAATDQRSCGPGAGCDLGRGGAVLR
jgi:hypothetical protein